MTKSLAALIAVFSLAAPALALAATPAVAEVSTCAKPVWPKESLRKEEQGAVQLAFLIGVDGNVRDTRVEKTSGYPLLDQAARDGLALCKFKPATENGQPVETWTRIRYVWTLEKSPQQTLAALRAAREGAERGDADAQYTLGMIYLSGQGVKQDHDEANKWLQKSAAQGLAEAQEAMGVLNSPQSLATGDTAQAISWFRAAAEQGRPRSQYFLAMLLRKEGKTDEALPWLRKAVAKNYPAAQAMMGGLLLATGRAEDQAEAIGLLKKAAQQNERSAQVALGECYENGFGVSQDYAKAAAFYQRAASVNNLRALVALARLYDNGQGVPKDAAKAQQLRDQAVTGQ